MPGASKRYGVRYGRRLRQKWEAVDTEQKKQYKCPYCHKIAVKRMAVGIWNCPKCAAVFTGKAYSIAQKPGQEEGVKETKLLEETETEEGEEELEETEEQQFSEQETQEQTE